MIKSQENARNAILDKFLLWKGHALKPLSLKTETTTVPNGILTGIYVSDVPPNPFLTNLDCAS
jgi:hypothetical protein